MEASPTSCGQGLANVWQGKSRPVSFEEDKNALANKKPNALLDAGPLSPPGDPVLAREYLISTAVEALLWLALVPVRQERSTVIADKPGSAPQPRASQALDLATAGPDFVMCLWGLGSFNEGNRHIMGSAKRHFSSLFTSCIVLMLLAHTHASSD